VVGGLLVGRRKQDTPTSAIQRRISRLLSLYAYWSHVDEVAALLCEEHSGPDGREGCSATNGTSDFKPAFAAISIIWVTAANARPRPLAPGRSQ
jgi:hypothetical protein